MKILSSPLFMQRFHASAAIVWLLLLAPSWFWWRSSLFFVLAISLYANFATHWGAWQAARSEVEAAKATRAAEEVGQDIDELMD